MRVAALVIVSMAAGVTADECGRICELFPGVCSSKGSYCKSQDSCMDLFHSDEFGFCNLSQPGCSSARPVKCSQARELTDGAVSTPTTARPATSRPGTTATPVETRPEPARGGGSAAAAASAAAEGMRGIRNLGATCYLGSVLQVLFHSPAVREAVEAQASGPVSRPFRDMLRQMWTEGADPLDVTPLLGVLRTANGGNGFRNEADDASISAGVLLNVLANESPALARAFTMDVAQDINCLTCGAARVGASARRSHLVAIPDPSRSTRFIDMLRQHFAGGILPELQCRVCGDDDSSLVVPRVATPPRVLVMTINRYTLAAEKLTTSVEIPFELNLSDVVATDVPQRYRLIGIVRHNNGHYTSDYLHPTTGTWVHTDDSRVHAIAGRPGNSGPTPSMVIYEAI